jgi:hypothetical protein
LLTTFNCRAISIENLWFLFGQVSAVGANSTIKAVYLIRKKFPWSVMFDRKPWGGFGQGGGIQKRPYMKGPCFRPCGEIKFITKSKIPTG